MKPSMETEPILSKKIAIAGTGYVGLSLAVLLSQHNEVTAVDIVEEKVNKINRWESPIQDDYIERYLARHEEMGLRLHATLDGASAYKEADVIVVAAPTNYDPKTNYFDCRAVESVLLQVKEVTADRADKPVVIIKSTIPVGYTHSVREKFGMDNILFSPEYGYPALRRGRPGRRTAGAFKGLGKEGERPAGEIPLVSDPHRDQRGAEHPAVQDAGFSRGNAPGRGAMAHRLSGIIRRHILSAGRSAPAAAAEICAEPVRKGRGGGPRHPGNDFQKQASSRAESPSEKPGSGGDV